MCLWSGRSKSLAGEKSACSFSVHKREEGCKDSPGTGARTVGGAEGGATGPTQGPSNLSREFHRSASTTYTKSKYSYYV